jgi:DNA-binding response OmpR family regulator
MAREDDRAATGESFEVPPPVSAGESRKFRILLADDNAGTLEYMGRLLSDRYDVEVAMDGKAALACARQRPPDLVLTDASMPGLDGPGLSRALRSDPVTSHVPILIMSARIGDESRWEALNAGADDYLEKPFSAAELLAAIRRLLGNSTPK